jgi:hypothetical protein
MVPVTLENREVDVQYYKIVYFSGFGCEVGTSVME